MWLIPYTRQISSSVVQTITIPSLLHIPADSEAYWKKRYLLHLHFYSIWGSTKLDNLTHHNLFFDDFDEHASSIYDSPEWPKDPIYVTSIDFDMSMAPKGRSLFYFDSNSTWTRTPKPSRQILQYRRNTNGGTHQSID